MRGNFRQSPAARPIEAGDPAPPGASRSRGRGRYYRKQAGTKVALQLVRATNAALDQLELAPGIGSPALGRLLGVAGLRTWRVGKFPLLWFYFERADHLDVVRLLGERQNIAAIVVAELARS